MGRISAWVAAGQAIPNHGSRNTRPVTILVRKVPAALDRWRENSPRPRPVNPECRQASIRKPTFRPTWKCAT
jgi:hypothetical protein